MAYPGSGHNFFNINHLRVLGVLCGEISGLRDGPARVQYVLRCADILLNRRDVVITS